VKLRNAATTSSPLFCWLSLLRDVLSFVLLSGYEPEGRQFESLRAAIVFIDLLTKGT
jgi:hypothetical protein